MAACVLVSFYIKFLGKTGTGNKIIEIYHAGDRLESVDISLGRRPSEMSTDSNKEKIFLDIIKRNGGILTAMVTSNSMNIIEFLYILHLLKRKRAR